MAQDASSQSDIPFGAMEAPPQRTSTESKSGDGGSAKAEAPGQKGSKKDWRKPQNRRGSNRRGGRRRRRGSGESQGDGEATATAESPAEVESPNRSGGNEEEGSGRRRRRRGGRSGRRRSGEDTSTSASTSAPAESQLVSGMVSLDKGGFAFLRRAENSFMPQKSDAWVSKQLVQRFKLRDGAIVEGKLGKGPGGKHKVALKSVDTVDGRAPNDVANLVAFKKLTSIDPDFHYAVGDASDDVSMRILDVICPVGRGARGLIVAPPRSGKTILMRKFANAIEETYPDVHLMVLLVDERPEEATEWRRSTKGEVFVSTNDEMAKHHVQLAEAVWKRCQRLVELGEEVILLLDSITRLARAYNNHSGGSGRTMSGGLDSRAMERPRAIFGSARNTETAGSLTILGTTLVETGSRMDQLIFEEFKGTGNMEIVLSRKLADRRIFPAIDVERSGTRKEEKLFSGKRLRRVHTLRRVLLKMNFIEAMELLITKLEDVEQIDDFLQRFDIDPEA